MSAIRFEATLPTIAPWIILRLPKEASAKLPSRGQTMVKRAINGVRFQTALEPDGKGSHWLKVEDGIRKAALTGSSSSLYTCTVVKDSLVSWRACDIYAGLPLMPFCFLVKQ